MARAIAISLLLHVAGAIAALPAKSFTNVTKVETLAIAFGTASSHSNEVFIPASTGASVGVLESFDSGKTYSLVNNVGADVNAMILMAAAADSAEPPAVVVAGVFGAGISTDNGASFSPLSLGKVMISQDVKFEDRTSNLFGVAGLFNGMPGVSVSNDHGSTFSLSTIPADLFVAPDVRYASYPTATTWYVTAGMWNSSTMQNTASRKSSTRLSAHVSVGSDGAVYYAKNTETEDASTEGWWGQVAKTNDAGQTWELVFDDQTSGLYANDIHCFGYSTCVFAMEGIGNPKIMVTKDGGETWSSFEDPSGPGMSLLGVRMTGPTEAWVIGGGDVGRVWHSINLRTWDMYETTSQEAASLVSFAVSADGTSIFATGILRSQLCSVLTIKI